MDRSNADRFRDLLFYVIILLVGYLVFTVIKPFLAPLAWATIFALTFNPLRDSLTARIGAPRAALVLTLVKTVMIIKGVNQNWAQVIQGALIVVVVMIGGLAIRQKGKTG